MFGRFVLFEYFTFQPHLARAIYHFKIYTTKRKHSKCKPYISVYNLKNALCHYCCCKKFIYRQITEWFPIILGKSCPEVLNSHFSWLLLLSPRIPFWRENTHNWDKLSSILWYRWDCGHHLKFTIWISSLSTASLISIARILLDFLSLGL